MQVVGHEWLVEDGRLRSTPQHCPVEAKTLPRRKMDAWAGSQFLSKYPIGHTVISSFGISHFWVEKNVATPNFRVRILPVLGTMPAIFGLTMANYLMS